ADTEIGVAEAALAAEVPCHALLHPCDSPDEPGLAFVLPPRGQWRKTKVSPFEQFDRMRRYTSLRAKSWGTRQDGKDRTAGHQRDGLRFFSSLHCVCTALPRL